MSWVAVPSEMKASPGRDRAEADRAHGCVAAARGQNDAARQAEFVGGFGRDPPGLGRPLDQRRRPGGIGFAGCEGFRRPGPRRLVEEPRSGRVAHIGGEVASELEAQIVLRRHDPGGAAAIVRLMPGDPFELRPGEAGHRLDADDPARARGDRTRVPAPRRRRGASLCRMAGRTGFLARSSRTAPCIWPEKPIAFSAPSALPAEFLISAIAPAMAAAQTSGSCSDQPACGRSGE